MGETTPATNGSDAGAIPTSSGNARQESAALLARSTGDIAADKIQKVYEDVELIRQATEKSKAEVSAQAEVLRQQILELSQLTVNISTANQQSKDIAGQANAALEGARALAEVAGKSVSLIEALRVQVEQAAQVVLQKSEHIEGGRAHADQVRAQLDHLLAQVQQSVERSKAETAAQLGAISESSAAMQEQVEAIRSASSASKETTAQAVAALEAARAIADSASKSSGQIEALKTQVEQAAEVVAKRSDHIEHGRVHADTVGANIDRMFGQVRQAADEASAQLDKCRATHATAVALQEATQTARGTADSLVEAIANRRSTIEAHVAVTKGLAERAENVEERLADYEKALKELHEQSSKQRATIDELLLGATNAGLASAYDQRSRTFRPQARTWNAVFICSLVGLLGIALWQALALGAIAQPPEWQQLLRMFLLKIPFIVPLVWLALHSSHQATTAKRMEEEYAFKATSSMTFEGYRRQMADVSKDLAPNSPLAQLCSHTLTTIASPPGRVYDNQPMPPTPGTAVVDFVGPVVDGVTKAIASSVPALPKG